MGRVTADPTEAEKWYRKAAAQGNLLSISYVGDLYRYGTGEQQDYAEALRWYEQAAARSTRGNR
jgi:TPR repeat protein